ncbi:MAG: hypothetical protein KFB92_05110 [Alcanivorax sp.]|nr:MAG: hypothetical protein KFB92_05110 [Alcanivorax sp.]
MKNMTFVLLCLVAVLAACGGGSSSSGGTTAAGPGAEQPGTEQPDPGTPEGGGALSGAVQKGPFQAGATARLQRLVNGAVDSDTAALETTVDERGRYAFPETGFVGPALLTVSGFWFDEGEGQFSGEPVTLSAVVFLEEGEQAADANVNVLTDLISERLMAELAEENDDYAAALASLMPDYRELTGLRRPPGQLDMLAGFIPGETLDVGLYQEVRVLPLLSAAVAENGLPAMEAGRAGFARGGADDEDAVAFWDAMKTGYGTLLAEYPDEEALVAEIQQNLSAQYPLGEGEGFPPASLGALSEAVGFAPACSQGPDGGEEGYRRICVDAGTQTTSLESGEGNAREFYLEAPYGGAFTLRLSHGDQEPDSNTVFQYRRAGSSGPGTVLEECSTRRACTVASMSLRKGDRLYVRALFNSGEARAISVEAVPLSDGFWLEPVIIEPFLIPHQGQVGSRDGSGAPSGYAAEVANSHAHYFFAINNTTGRTLVVDEFLCGDDILPPGHSTRVLLAKLVGNSAEVVSERSVRSCEGFRHEFEGGQNGVYYLRVHADYQRVTGLNPSSAPYRFRIRGL